MKVINIFPYGNVLVLDVDKLKEQLKEDRDKYVYGISYNCSKSNAYKRIKKATKRLREIFEIRW